MGVWASLNIKEAIKELRKKVIEELTNLDSVYRKKRTLLCQ